MKRVYSAQDLFIVSFLKDVLEEHNIPCILKNQYLAGAAGELPPIECWPALWVKEDSDFDTALRLIEDRLKENAKGEPWICAQCGEPIEGQFTECWNCGQGRFD